MLHHRSDRLAIMGGRILVGKKKWNGEMRKKGNAEWKERKEKKPYYQIYCKFAKPQMNSLPFQILYFSQETSFLLLSRFNLSAHQYLRTAGVLSPLSPLGPFTAITSHNALIQTTRRCRTMSPAPIWRQFLTSSSILYLHIFKIFSLIPGPSSRWCAYVSLLIRRDHVRNYEHSKFKNQT